MTLHNTQKDTQFQQNILRVYDRLYCKECEQNISWIVGPSAQFLYLFQETNLNYSRQDTETMRLTAMLCSTISHMCHNIEAVTTKKTIRAFIFYPGTYVSCKDFRFFSFCCVTSSRKVRSVGIDALLFILF
jgi:hypothetical protein